MKKLIVLLFALFYLNYTIQAQSSGQVIESAEFENDMIHLFENLDLSEINSGFFYDKAFPFIGLELFDGTINSGQLTINHFGKVYATLHDAGMTSSDTLPDPAIYMDKWQETKQSDTISLAMLLYSYQQFKEDAISLNLIDSINGQFFDVANRSESPYEEKIVFAASILHNQPFSTDLSFEFDHDLLFSNMVENIDEILIDLDDGNGYQELNDQDIISTSYGNSDPKNITIICSLNDGTLLYSYTRLSFELVPLNQDYGNNPDFVIPIPATSTHSGGHLDVFLSCPSEGLVKPLVIIDGYDPPQKPENRSYVDMLIKLGDEVFEGNNKKLIDFLEDEGYDLIFMDYNYGSDYLERNAEFAKAGIDSINLYKTLNSSGEKNVIAGASMGGVVGKYALLDMEEDGEDHDTRLFINFDGPMQGANIPVGLQDMILHLANTPVRGIDYEVTNGTAHLIFNPAFQKPIREYVPEAKGAYDILHEPATQQFLYYQSISRSTGLINQEFVDFYDKLNQFSEPSDFEYIALSNGSVTSTPQQLFTAGDQLLDVDLNYNALELTEILEELEVINGWNPWYLSGLYIDRFNSPGLFSFGFRLAVLTSILSTRVDANFELYSLHDNLSTEERVYFGKLTARVLGSPIIKTKLETTTKETEPYDSAPGGLNGFHPDLISDNVPSSVIDDITIFHNAICFVPVVSSLDIKAPEREDLFLDLSDYNNVTSNLTALARYDASEDGTIQTYGDFQENQEHSEINLSNAPFLLYEVARQNGLVGINNINDKTYNFGDSNTPFDSDNPEKIASTSNVIKENLVILNQGMVWVNRNDKLGFTDDDNFDNSTQSTFDVRIRSKCEGTNVFVTVRDGGNILVGDWENGIENDGTLFIEKGGRLRILDGGKVDVGRFSKIVIKDGGILTIKDGGRLLMQKGGKVIIEDGGRMIIEEGARIDLWWGDHNYQGQLQEGSNIHVKGGGLLWIYGDFDFYGAGFFQFDEGHYLSLVDEFKLSGTGKDKRFIQLNEKAVLKIDYRKIDLSYGKVDFKEGSSIRLTEEGIADFSHVTLSGKGSYTDDAVGIDADHPELIELLDVDFIDLEDGINLSYKNQPNYPAILPEFNLNLCSFTNCHIGISATNNLSTTLPKINIESSLFDAGVEGYRGLSLNYFRSVDIIGGGFRNYRDNSEDVETAIYLNDVQALRIKSSDIYDNDLGIYIPDIESPNQSNVFLFDGSEIKNNEKGIWIEKGGISTNGIDYGMVHMDCAKLINNVTGIEGTDILLNIDACSNSGQFGSCDNTLVRPNVFINDGISISDFFHICYEDRDDITEINARGNYWQSNGTGGLPGDFDHLLRSADSNLPCSQGYSDMNLITDDNVDIEPTSCGDIIIVVDPDPGSTIKQDCFTSGGSTTLITCMTGSGSEAWALNQKLTDAYLAYTDNQETESYSLYNDLASIPDTERDAFCEPCRHYIDVARVMAVGDAVQGFATPHNDKIEIIDLSQKEKKEGKIRIFPNPTNGDFTIDSNGKNIQIKVLDVFGKDHHLSTSHSKTIINTKDWSSGIYFVEITDLKTSEVIGYVQ